MTKISKEIKVSIFLAFLVYLVGKNNYGLFTRSELTMQCYADFIFDLTEPLNKLFIHDRLLRRIVITVSSLVCDILFVWFFYDFVLKSYSYKSILHFTFFYGLRGIVQV